MAVRNCCIATCKSSSTRKEDKGVTYHKFPKNVALYDTWMSVTYHKHTDSVLPMYVCSRHFCKNDFQIYKDSKYILKSDAVPSIFPWNVTSYMKTEMESLNSVEQLASDQDASTSKESKDCDEIESIAAIKKFIEEQEKEIQNQKCSIEKPITEKSHDDSVDNKFSQGETISVASSVLDMIITESELEIARKVDVNSKIISPDKGSVTNVLSVGSKVEAKDFAEYWHSAEVVEVDCDEMEVLVHYVIDTKKHDEWISINSSRLRPAGSVTVQAGPSSVESVSSDRTPSPLNNTEEPKNEIKADDKVRPTFVVGERCLARWRDNRRFVATIHKVLDNGSYEIIFDDGCHWTCTMSRLYKMRPGKEGVSSGAPNTPNIASPQYSPGTDPSNATAQTNTYTAYHKHLFDPTRDYLGSKSERREMKRKLNIKEIFNIGQKRQKSPKVQSDATPKAPVERKPRIIRRKDFKLTPKSKVKPEVKSEDSAVDAVASIIGTINKDNIQGVRQDITTDTIQENTTENKQEITSGVIQENADISQLPMEEQSSTNEIDFKDDKEWKLEDEVKSAEDMSVTESIEESDNEAIEDLKPYIDPERLPSGQQVLEEEVKLEQFEKPDEGTHEEVIVRIKEAINKLEDGLKVESTSTASPKLEIKIEIPKVQIPVVNIENISPVVVEKAPEPISVDIDKSKKKLSKIKKGKKLRLLREKKVKKQVEKVKSELEAMKKQVEQMRQQMLRTQELGIRNQEKAEMPESFLLPGEWCCKWVNGQPVGTVSEMECEMKYDPNGKPPLPRRSVQVEDKRLPEGWTKHMVRRSLGNSAGKWDIVLISPDNRRFHTKNEMRVYLENNPDNDLKDYEHALTDFGVHLKLARNMGWITNTPDGIANAPDNHLQAGELSSTSPLIKRRKLGLKRNEMKKVPKIKIKVKKPHRPMTHEGYAVASTSFGNFEAFVPDVDANVEQLSATTLEDGFVYVGSLKVQVIDNLLRCPAEGCFKNFRNNTLLQMHIKHYHRELRKMMGATPKVLDLASARSMPGESEITPRPKEDQKVIKVKISRPSKTKYEDLKLEVKDENNDLERPITPVMDSEVGIPRNQDSPKLRQALINKPIKRPRVLLPVRKVEPERAIPDSMNEDLDFETKEPMDPGPEILPMENLDFEMAISTHTVTKPIGDNKRKTEKKKKPFILAPKALLSEEEDWFTMNSDVETRSSFPRSGTPDSKLDSKATLVSSESNEENKDTANMYMYNENGERIKIVHMKREEIINCHCGYREEDGLMVQCELCLCWQHALCHNIQRETDVPAKYTCSICLNPRRGRRSKRFVHDQDRLYEGLLPGARPDETLRRSHELTGNLLKIEDALHALRVKYYVATKKDHPKLYLWAKEWEHAEIQYTQEKLNSDYSDLNIIIHNIGKENMPMKPEDIKDMPLDIRASPSEDSEHDKFSHRDLPLGSQSLLSGLLSSPGGTSLDLPISTSELERLAKSVQEQENQSQHVLVTAPQPEAAIENDACRERLLKHIQRCQGLIEARLDSIEAQVAELESQDPAYEDDETPEYFPRTKQTIQMLMRDLDSMEELGIIT